MYWSAYWQPVNRIHSNKRRGLKATPNSVLTTILMSQYWTQILEPLGGRLLEVLRYRIVIMA